jgi:hypothetical protein
MATVPRSHHVTTHLYQWQKQIIWILAAGVVGFAMTTLFTSVFEVSREWWVAAHLTVVSLLAAAYASWANVKVGEVVRRHWLAGVVGGAIIAFVVAFSVINTQDASAREHGLTFVWQIVWLGVAYGAADAMLLNVLPVYAAWQASSELGHTKTWRGKIVTGVVALLASLAVTVMYHAGYAEFRGTDMGQPVLGNTLISVAYVLSGNPITAFAGHIAMHIAAVVHGISSTAVLPPHY